MIRALGAATVRLGDDALTAADWGYAKPRELLFLLATSPPLTGSRSAPPCGRTRRASSWATRCIRHCGNCAAPSATPGGWCMRTAGTPQPGAPRDCDVDTFTSALAAARQARPAGAAMPDLQRAISAYGGDFLAGTAAGEWAHARRDELAAPSSRRCSRSGGCTWRRAAIRRPLQPSAGP